MIHREGYFILAVTALVVAGVLFLTWRFMSVIWVKSLITTACLVVFGLFLQFFRNPSRHTEVNPHHVIAPADGKIVVIEEVDEPEYFKDRRIQVSIFMSPFNVHVNRNPVSGSVSYFKYHPGEYLVAWHPKSSTENERTTTVIKNAAGEEILFRQIAGAVARRIRWYVQEGDAVEQGQEMGFIKFGSRVDVFLPLDAEVNVAIDQITRGGETVLATFK
ncbi:MAG: phosphatidylserine decarboxylase family protein [Flavobacteriales bacterium]|nr:phosphatidylserine decarboxylase family protein [Flavobacteriales bacterium]